jgi:hypothetical protein
MTLRLVKNSVNNQIKKTPVSKKETILSLFKKGVTDIEKIAKVSQSKPSYVGAVLQKEGLINNYFDLYTSTGKPMNIYTKYFQGKLGFKNVKTAEASVKTLEQVYCFFANQQDRAGQHHALEMALTMLDRARWTGKVSEAEVYRLWLFGKLSLPLTEEIEQKAQRVELRLAA